MVTLSRRNKITITTIVAVAVILVITLPLASAQATNNAVSNMKTLSAQGNIYQKIDSQTIKYYPATLTLTLQPTSSNGAIKKFDVTGGKIVANGVSYTIRSGNGGVLTDRHTVLLQAQGTSPDGQSVTLKLSGQYSWFDVRSLKIGAKLQTEDINYTLLMRAAI
jgi:hypothetical protein